MSTESTTDGPLTYEDIGHLLDAKADKLTEGEGDPEAVIREVLETLSRAETVRPRRKTVDPNGRVSMGRDLSGVHGLALFHADSEELDDTDTGGDGL